jgi:AcrR family transcriptional regulator
MLTVGTSDRKTVQESQLERTSAPGSDPPNTPLYRKLKPGPGKKRDQVGANQRGRLQGAMIELAAGRGYENVTVRDLAQLAGVSTRSFYEHFSNADDCMAATYEAVANRVSRRVADAQTAAGELRPDGDLRARVEALMREFATRPKSARLLLIEPYAAGNALGVVAGRAECRLGRLLLSGTERPAVASRASRTVAAGIARVARSRLVVGRAAELPVLSPELTAWVRAMDSALSDSASSCSTARRPPPERAVGVPTLGRAGDEGARILTATARIAATKGFASLTIPTIRSEAGVSRRVFDARFRDIPECFAEAVESLARTAVGRTVREAFATSDGRPFARIAAGVCLELVRNPALARLLFIEVPGAGRAGLTTREELISEATAAMRRLSPDPFAAHLVPAEASIAAAWQILDAEAAGGKSLRLATLGPVATSVATALVGPTASLSG